MPANRLAAGGGGGGGLGCRMGWVIGVDRGGGGDPPLGGGRPPRGGGGGGCSVPGDGSGA